LLPDAGKTVTYYDVNPTAAARGADNYQTFETDYAPARTQYWHGVNTNLNARLRNGITIQAGTTTGRGVQNTCALYEALPELLLVAGVNQRLESCDVREPWTTWFRGLATYTVPKFDVLVSASLRSVPNASLGAGSISATNGTSRVAAYYVPNTEVQKSLGRLPSGQSSTGVTGVNLLLPGQLYGPRINQVDMRFAKIVRFSGRRADIGIDLYNLLNTSDPTTFQETFDYATGGATYMRPTSLVSPRFARFNVTLNF
jgi:hypothetical protein